MWWSSEKHCTRLCPVSLGLAVGFTSVIAVVAWLLFIMFQGAPPMVADALPALSFMNVLGYAVSALVRGFIFGFLVALLYNLFCWCKEKCCRGNKV